MNAAWGCALSLGAVFVTFAGSALAVGFWIAVVVRTVQELT